MTTYRHYRVGDIDTDSNADAAAISRMWGLVVYVFDDYKPTQRWIHDGNRWVPHFAAQIIIPTRTEPDPVHGELLCR